jgi:hypothetical protein
MILWGVVFAAFGVAEVSCRPEDPAACLKWLTLHGHVKTVELADSSLIGQWTEGPGLSGSELYLFADHTYIHTQWADVIPETIYDKGRWALSGGALTLSPDADIVWRTTNDRTYLALRQGDDETVLLLGLKRAFAYVSYMAADKLEDTPMHVRLASRTRHVTWKDAQAKGVKAAIMKRGWRPDWHGK